MELVNYNFDIYNQFVDLYFDTNQSLRVYINQNSGKIYKRSKQESLFSAFVDHKGIYIGYSEMGEHVMVHNHTSPGRAVLLTWEGFAQNEKTYLDNKICTNDPLTRIEIALQKVLLREPYDLINNSCQTLVNQACTNERKNDDTAKVVLSILGTGLVVGVLASIFGD